MWALAIRLEANLAFPGFHRVIPFGDNLVDVAAQLALKGANVEA